MTNSFEIRGKEVAIFIKQRRGPTVEAIVDLDDLPLVASIEGTWGPQNAKNSNIYVQTRRYIWVNDKYTHDASLLMHRMIALSGAKDDPLASSHPVDHINHNTLDNRRSNLRVASRVLNALNRSKPSVYRLRDGWTACITYRGIRIGLGNYTEQSSAVIAYAGALLAVEAIELSRQ